MYDVIIIGSGPAGVSAALTAKARNLDFVWFGSRDFSKKIERAEKIMNYPGLIAVSGKEMQKVFQTQIAQCGIEITEERVDSVYNMGTHYIACVNEKMYETKTVILALGVSGTREIPGEREFLGKGVSYCATCDGELYRGKNIAVICTDRSQEDEIEYLAAIAASVKVYTNYQDCNVKCDNVICHVGYPQKITGDQKARALWYKGEKVLTDGIFCLHVSVSPAVLLEGLAMEEGHVMVDRRQQTNIPGCFAAGDCTGRPYQYIKAAGEGNVALHSVLKYLQEKAGRGY